MDLYFITFRSATYAQRAEVLLNRRGIRSAIMRTPRWMEEQGCGYALKLRSDHIARVIRYLLDNEISLRRVYQQKEEGRLEEIVP